MGKYAVHPDWYEGQSGHAEREAREAEAKAAQAAREAVAALADWQAAREAVQAARALPYVSGDDTKAEVSWEAVQAVALPAKQAARAALALSLALTEAASARQAAVQAEKGFRVYCRISENPDGVDTEAEADLI